MTDEQKKQLEQQLWNIANALRGKMNADEFRDYILGFIFYKYLSEKMLNAANDLLKEDGFCYQDIDEATEEGQDYLEAVKDNVLPELGYFLKPSELFSVIAKKGNLSEDAEEATSTFILADLSRILKNIISVPLLIVPVALT